MSFSSLHDLLNVKNLPRYMEFPTNGIFSLRFQSFNKSSVRAWNLTSAFLFLLSESILIESQNDISQTKANLGTQADAEKM